MIVIMQIRRKAAPAAMPAMVGTEREVWEDEAEALEAVGEGAWVGTAVGLPVAVMMGPAADSPSDVGYPRTMHRSS